MVNHWSLHVIPSPHLVSELGSLAYLLAITASAGSRLSDPVGEVAHKIEEEISLGNGNDFVRDFHEERKALRALEIQPDHEMKTN